MSYGRVLEGSLQDYAWGRTDGLRTWTGLGTGGPEAELWFGTHPAAPSRTVCSLPEGAPRLGDAPLLVKILAAARPLSLQVHPSARAIAAIRGLGRGDLLADDGEKSELLVAVERMEALVGLRPPAAAGEVVAALGLADAAARAARGDVAGAITAMVSGDAVPDLATGLAVLPPEERDVMQRVVEACPDDRSLPIAFLLQPVVLEPGDAACVPVGVPHAYVDGLGVEVMTSCDNVLRLGLTPKTVSVEAALLALDPAAGPHLLRGAEARGSYDSALMPFTLKRLADGDTVALAPGAIALALSGDLTVTSPLGALHAHAGQAVYAERDAGWTLQATGVAFAATPRVQNPCDG